MTVVGTECNGAAFNEYPHQKFFWEFNIPYLPEYKSHPSISHNLYFCGANFYCNF